MIRLLSASAENFETIKLNNPSMLSVAILLGLIFITAIVVIFIKSGRD